MAANISAELRRELFKQESGDPFLTLITLSNPNFIHRLVNNVENIISRDNTYTAFPVKIRLPVDDGQSAREFSIDFDNASLELISSLRSVSGNIGVTVEMILASMPDVVQIGFSDLLVSSLTYNATKISARVTMDNFLSVAMTSERYTPTLYPGLF